MNPRIRDVIVGILLSSILMLIASCDSWRTETVKVKGKFSHEIVITKDGTKTIRKAIILEGKILILDFSAKTYFDKNMKSLPYPKNNGFYEIPEGSKGAGALQMENGEMIYFQGDKEYEVTGMLGEVAEIDLLPLEQATKKYLLLTVKNIKMSEANN